MNNSIKKFLSVGLAGVLASVSASILAVNSFAVNRELVYRGGRYAPYTCYIKTNRPDGLRSIESIAASWSTFRGRNIHPDDLDADYIIGPKVRIDEHGDEHELILQRIFDYNFLVENGDKIDSVTVTDNNGTPVACRRESTMGALTCGRIFYENTRPESLTININFSE